MDYYANPPLMMVEFGALENDQPTSPIGSPPSTPQHQPSLFFAAERTTPTPTSTQHQTNVKPSDGPAPQHLLQPAYDHDDDEDIPMDERRHYHNGTNNGRIAGGRSSSALVDEDGPDDEKWARRTNAAISPPSNMQMDSNTAFNPPPARNRGQPASPSQRLAYNRSNSGQMRNGDTTKHSNGMVKNGSVQNMVSKYETSPMMKTPEKEDLLSPPKLYKKADLWNDSPALGSRLPPSSANKRPTTRNRPTFRHEDEDAPDDERPSQVVETAGSDVPEDERMATMSTSASAAAKERFARSSGRQVDPSSSKQFAGELTRRLEAAQTNNGPEGDELMKPTVTPSMNTVRNNDDVKQDRSSPNHRRPAPRRLNYDGGDSPPNREDVLRSRAEILQDSAEADPTKTQNLRRLRLSEGSPIRNGMQQQQQQETTSPPSAPVPVYPPRISSAWAASIKRILTTIPKTDSLWDLRTQNLVPVPSLESYIGIAKGDLTLSLLPHESPASSSEEATKRISGADRVQLAIGTIWSVRKASGMLDISNNISTKRKTSTSPLRPPLPVGGNDVVGMHAAALSHLLVNDIDRAMGCYREIMSLYKTQKEKNTKGPPSPRNEAQTDFELAFSVVLHNLGILNLLKKKYFTAMTYFANALEARQNCLVDGHISQVACLAKMAICQCALDQFDDAHTTLKRAVGYANKQSSSLSLNDRLMLAEMMNNLGVLNLKKGLLDAADERFVGCLDILQSAASDCLYEDNLSQSVSLNIVIVRGNAGFAKMAAKDFKGAIPHVEKAVLGLNGVLKSGDEISVAIMDCLAAANLLSGRKDRASKIYSRVLQILKNECSQGDPRVPKTMHILECAGSAGRGTQEAFEALAQSFAIITETGTERVDWDV